MSLKYVFKYLFIIILISAWNDVSNGGMVEALFGQSQELPHQHVANMCQD